MAMKHTKPTTISTFHAVMYSPTQLFMTFINNHILVLTTATCIQL